MALMESKTKQPGWEAPDFSLPDTDGKIVTPSDFFGKKGLLVLFTCNHCPYAKASWPIVIALAKQYGDGVGFVAINPNDAEAYPDDSPEQMKQKKQEWGIPFQYLFDESQAVAKLYGAQCTPDPYLFKNEGGRFRLFYHGRINDNWQEPEKVTQENLKNAIEALLQDAVPPATQPPSMGCSIKWKE